MVCACVESLQLHSILVVSSVLKVEISVDSTVKKFLVTASQEDQEKVLVFCAGHRRCCVIRNL